MLLKYFWIVIHIRIKYILQKYPTGAKYGYRDTYKTENFFRACRLPLNLKENIADKTNSWASD
jgi:hypothetical protein